MKLTLSGYVIAIDGPWWYRERNMWTALGVSRCSEGGNSLTHNTYGLTSNSTYTVSAHTASDCSDASEFARASPRTSGRIKNSGRPWGVLGGGKPHPLAPSPLQSDREGEWIPAGAGMTDWGRGVGLDCGLRRNDGGLGAVNRAST